MFSLISSSFFFFFNDTATTEIYTLSLHDALPISVPAQQRSEQPVRRRQYSHRHPRQRRADPAVYSHGGGGVQPHPGGPRPADRGHQTESGSPRPGAGVEAGGRYGKRRRPRGGRSPRAPGIPAGSA